MKITRLGWYRVIHPITTYDYYCYDTLEPGDVLEITRIDNGDVWGPGLCDWKDADMPVEPIEVHMQTGDILTIDGTDEYVVEDADNDCRTVNVRCTKESCVTAEGWPIYKLGERFGNLQRRFHFAND